MTLLEKLVIIAIILFVASLALFVPKEERTWKKYSEAHHCVRKAHVEGVSVFSATGTTYVPASDTYTCDNGETITR